MVVIFSSRTRPFRATTSGGSDTNHARLRESTTSRSHEAGDTMPMPTPAARPITGATATSTPVAAPASTTSTISKRGDTRSRTASAQATNAPRDSDATDDDGLRTAKHSLGFILNLRAEPTATAKRTVSSHAVGAAETEACPRPTVACVPPSLAGSWTKSAGEPRADPRVAPPTPQRLRSSRASTRVAGSHERQNHVTNVETPQAPARASPVRHAKAKAKSKATAPRTTRKATPRAKTKAAADPLGYAQKRLARKCSVDGCANYTINKGLCFRHGGGKKCTFDGCGASAKIAGLCWKHGGSIQCIVDGCDRRGKSRGRCWAHGGGTKCSTETCEKVAVSNGLCWAHGGGKRCQFDGCQRPAYERTLNYCPKHFKKFESGEEVLEL